MIPNGLPGIQANICSLILHLNLLNALQIHKLCKHVSLCISDLVLRIFIDAVHLPVCTSKLHELVSPGIPELWEAVDEEHQGVLWVTLGNVVQGQVLCTHGAKRQ